MRTAMLKFVEKKMRTKRDSSFTFTAGHNKFE